MSAKTQAQWIAIIKEKIESGMTFEQVINANIGIGLNKEKIPGYAIGVYYKEVNSDK